MHPRCVHSYAHPMDCVDNSQWNLHFLDTEHHPAKSFHFLDQTVHCVEHWQQTNTQVDDRQLEHHFYPNYRHKPFPRYRCNRSPLCPLQVHFLQSVSKVLEYIVYKLEVNSYLGFEKQLYSLICYPVMHTEYFKMENFVFLCNLKGNSAMLFDRNVQRNRGILRNGTRLGIFILKEQPPTHRYNVVIFQLPLRWPYLLLRSRT